MVFFLHLHPEFQFYACNLSCYLETLILEFDDQSIYLKLQSNPQASKHVLFSG